MSPFLLSCAYPLFFIIDFIRQIMLVFYQPQLCSGFESIFKEIVNIGTFNFVFVQVRILYTILVHHFKAD